MIINASTMLAGKASRTDVHEWGASRGSGPWTDVGPDGPVGRLAVPGPVTLSESAAAAAAGFCRVRASAP
ncbi:MAG: hypothetical protein NTW21_16350 [Verrucomicrobia bacterium]|nr:hypothetical protein [Verrucomicrobiota bacterium]